MPKKGWRSITVTDEVYEFFFKEWQSHRDEYRMKYGITSFSGFTTKLLTEMAEKWKARREAGKNPQSRS